MIFYIIAILAGLIGALGDSFLNNWAKGDSVGWPSYVGGIVACNVALVLFSRLLTTSSLSRTVIVFLVANSVAIAFISLFYFREKPSLYQWLGMAVALGGVLIMEIGR